MKEFIQKLLSEDNTISHKRFVAIVSFVVFIILSFMSAYGHNPDEIVFTILASLIGGESILTVIEKFKSNK